MLKSFEISNGSIEEVVQVMEMLPEFNFPLKTKQEINEKLFGRKHQILIAKSETDFVGFKLSYDLGDNVLYSWLGGVLPSFREKGIAKALAKHQENWAITNGFTKVRFKTLNKHKAMLCFALKNGFDITDVDKSQQPAKIILEKELL
ncbi:Acetyltransferase (GNAT) domain-containing protein [Spirosomataceae bacterium TFI 002]|nr:Acetyltransferase (GNAT) domain-containing protein [Spirosomataceae bacterium TFI 002]